MLILPTITVNRDDFIILGLRSPIKRKRQRGLKEFDGWAIDFEIPACLPRCSPGCLPSPCSLELLTLNNVLGTTRQAMAPMPPALQRLCSPCLVPDDDTKAAAEQFTRQAHTHTEHKAGRWDSQHKEDKTSF